jgi:ribonuclease P protein component
MLPKKRRVGKELFPDVLKKSKSFYGENMSLRVFLADPSNETRFSFVVSKKVSNKANKRNLLKRRGYSIIKDTTKNINRGFVCVFFFKKSALTVSFADLRKEVLFMLKKSTVLN